MDCADQEDGDCCELGPDDGKKPATWLDIGENVYLVEQGRTKNGRLDRKMRCECELEVDEEGQPRDGCGEDCINRLLMIECHPKTCPCGDYCMNQRFQKKQYVDVDVFNTGTAKGWGLRALQRIPAGSFVREYVGEVCSFTEFQTRTTQYHEEGRRHHYFMTLHGDQIIDATLKGSVSRFMNHSCEPNCETQKWMVNGRLKVGFFATEDIEENEEMTFDYQFERMGDAAQECFCGAPSCSGYIGGKQQRGERGSLTAAPGRANRKARSSPLVEDEMTRKVRQCCHQSHGLVHEDDVLVLSRLMVTAESTQHRLLVLDALTRTKNDKCLRAFVKLQGLSLLWSWMVDTAGDVGHELPLRIMEALEHLPVMNRNVLKDSKVLEQVVKWSVVSSEEAASLQAGNEAQSGERSLLTQSSGDPTAASCTELGESNNRQPNSASSSDASPSQMSDGDSGVESPNSSSCALIGGDSRGEKSILKQKAEQLLEKWRDLKEVYRIPKKAPLAKENMTGKDSSAAAVHNSPSLAASEVDQKGRSSPFSRIRTAVKPNDLPPPPSKQSSFSPAHLKRSHPEDGPDKRRKILPPTTPIASVGNTSAPGLSQSPQLPAPRPQPPVAGPALGLPPMRNLPHIPPSVGAAAMAAGIPPPPLFAITSPVLASPRMVPGAVPQLQHPLPASPAVGLQATAVQSNVVSQPVIQVNSTALWPRQASPTAGSLPPNWQSARDSSGRLYYYHTLKRESQWEFPTGESIGDETPPLPTEPPTDDEGHTPDETPPMSDSEALPTGNNIERSPEFSPTKRPEKLREEHTSPHRKRATSSASSPDSKQAACNMELTLTEVRPST